ncbi:MAG: response regulator [Opitutales bacterium]|nr:response regulator [Opitutales bacterium]NRA27633.1 response regulator [Opitutales bacterium]
MSEAIKILLVEDDVMSSQYYKKMLGSRGYTVLPPASNGLEALKAAREIRPDLVIMDINIEGEIDGIETASRLKSEFNVPIIYATGSSEEEIITRAKSTADAYLLKPFTRRDLLITIDVALAKKEVEGRLRDSEARLATILSSIGNGVIAADASGKIVYFNDSAEVITGVILEKALGQGLESVIELRDPMTRERVSNFYENIPVLHHTANIPHAELITQSQTNRHVSVQLSPIFGEDDMPNGQVCVIVDITEQMESDDQLRTLGHALESINDAVLITDAATDEDNACPMVVFANKAFERIFGYETEEILYAPLSQLYGTDTDQCFIRNIQDAVHANHSFSLEVKLQHKSGDPICVEVSFSPVDDFSGGVSKFVAILRDVTHLRQLEEGVRQSQKIEAVGRLASGIAHDFNNLLSVINSYSDLLMVKFDDDDPTRKHLEQIFLAGRRGSDLVSKLMAFSRKETDDTQHIDLCSILHDIEGILTRVVREDIQLSINIRTQSAPTLAERSSVEQAIVNMVVNARDAITAIGEISLTLDTVEMTEKDFASEKNCPPGHYQRIAISDNGSGIDEGTLEKIFDPFFTTKDIGKGTGLGLSLVYSLMKRIGGDIQVKSTLGEGTQFLLYFPEVLEVDSTIRPIEHETPINEEELTKANGEKILIVEDDPIFGDCISSLLSLRGYDVISAENGVDAIERHQSEFPELSLVITDVVMPKMSGVDLAHKILETKSDARIIFMTGYDEDLETQYDLPKASLILQKPVSLKKVLEIVGETVGGN